MKGHSVRIGDVFNQNVWTQGALTKPILESALALKVRKLNGVMREPVFSTDLLCDEIATGAVTDIATSLVTTGIQWGDSSVTTDGAGGTTVLPAPDRRLILEPRQVSRTRIIVSTTFTPETMTHFLSYGTNNLTYSIPIMPVGFVFTVWGFGSGQATLNLQGGVYFYGAGIAANTASITHNEQAPLSFIYTNISSGIWGWFLI